MIAPASRSAALRTRALAFAEAHLPALTRLRRPEALPLRLDRRRIYVLPTTFGLGFVVLLLIMLVGALNYGNNPALLLTCLLAAAAWMSLFLGFRGMSGLELTGLRGHAVHAGDKINVQLVFASSPRTRPSLRLDGAGFATTFALSGADDDTLSLLVPTTRRGWLRLGRMRVWTSYPLGLFRCWSWINPEAELLVYPSPEHPTAPLPFDHGTRGERTQAAASSDEHAGLRGWRPSDPQRLIAWKASARHDTLLVREFEQPAGSTLLFDYARLPGMGHEARIARLCAWVLVAENAQHPYTLRLPNQAIGPGLGPVQREDCLRALAMLPIHD